MKHRRMQTIKTYSQHVKESESQGPDIWFLWGYKMQWKSQKHIPEPFKILGFFTDKQEAVKQFRNILEEKEQHGFPFYTIGWTNVQYDFNKIMKTEDAFDMIGVDTIHTIDQSINDQKMDVNFQEYIKSHNLDEIPGFSKEMLDKLMRSSKTRRLFGI